jgi:predicted GNAT family acetyltransferase
MAADNTALVSHDAASSRYELRLGERLVGTVDYVRRGDSLLLAHVGVDPEHRRRGYGSRLVAGALDDIRARGLSVVPACPFAAWYLRRHPEYGDLLARPRGAA